MPSKYGAQCSVWLDVVDESQFFNDAGLDLAVDTAETTTFQPGVSPAWKAFIEGLAAAKVTVKGFYDQVNDAAMMADVRNGGSTLTYGPAGLLTVGDLARLVWVHDTTVGESSPIGGAVLLNVAYQGDGTVGFGQCLHAMTTDSGTATGATKNDLAATSTGWLAHLHVTAVTGAPTSWTVKLQDSADGTTWADVAGGAFTATTIPAAQRLVSAAGATLRQYVRYVATVVGGTAPTVTFGLAYARNR
jgi:hypothetical protein